MGLPPRLWFKLERLKSAWRALLGTKEPSYDAVHRMCPSCRALIDRGASVCPLCGAAIRGARARAGTTPGRILGVIPIPSTATSALVAVNVGIYAITWYLTQNQAAAELSPAPAMGGVSAQVLLRLGAKSPLIFAGQWWRLVTAMFLHAGLLHIGMNLWCLFDLGPAVESLFSTTKFVVLYLTTGVAGFLLSLWFSPWTPSVGASGAILGLIGILIGASFHHGHLGKEYRGQLWRWVIYIFAIGVFGGFLGFGTDNAAHLGGLAAGALLGYVVPEGEPVDRPSENLWNALAVLSVLIMAGSFALMALGLNRPAR